MSRLKLSLLPSILSFWKYQFTLPIYLVMFIHRFRLPVSLISNNRNSNFPIHIYLFQNSFYTYNIFYDSQCGLHYKHYYRATFKHDYEEWVNDIFMIKIEISFSYYYNSFTAFILDKFLDWLYLRWFWIEG